MSKAFGNRLRKIRTERGMSQGELAGDELSSGYISLLELGQRHPSTDVVAYLAGRLGVSATELHTGEPSERDQRLTLELKYAKLLVEHGEAAEARRRLEPVLAEDGIPRPVRDDLLLLLGMACERSGDLEASLRVFLELLSRARALDTHIPMTTIGIGLVRAYLDGGDLHQAAVAGEQVLEIADARGLGGTTDYYRLAATVMAAHMGLGDYLSARLWAERYIAQAQADGQPASQAPLLWNAAVLAEHQGRLTDALALCERALDLHGDEAVRDSARLQRQMARLLLSGDEPRTDSALLLLQLCEETIADLGSRADRAQWAGLRAATHLLRGEPADALSRATEAVDLASGATPVHLAEAKMILSDVLMAQGQLDEAIPLLLSALAGLRGSDITRDTALTWRELAERLMASGCKDEAIEAFQVALDGAGTRSRFRMPEGAVKPAAVALVQKGFGPR